MPSGIYKHKPLSEETKAKIREWHAQQKLDKGPKIIFTRFPLTITVRNIQAVKCEYCLSGKYIPSQGKYKNGKEYIIDRCPFCLYKQQHLY